MSRVSLGLRLEHGNGRLGSDGTDPGGESLSPSVASSPPRRTMWPCRTPSWVGERLPGGICGMVAPELVRQALDLH